MDDFVEQYKGFELNRSRKASSTKGIRENANFKKLIDLAMKYKHRYFGDAADLNAGEYYTVGVSELLNADGSGVTPGSIFPNRDYAVIWNAGGTEIIGVAVINGLIADEGETVERYYRLKPVVLFGRVADVDLSGFEKKSNKATDFSIANHIKFPTTLAVENRLQTMLSSFPKTLKVPKKLDLESNLPPLSELEKSDCFMVQEMDETAPQHTGFIWINNDGTGGALVAHVVVDMYLHPDEVSLESDGNGALKVKDDWLRDLLNDYMPRFSHIPVVLNVQTIRDGGNYLIEADANNGCPITAKRWNVIVWQSQDLCNYVAYPFGNPAIEENVVYEATWCQGVWSGWKIRTTSQGVDGKLNVSVGLGLFKEQNVNVEMPASSTNQMYIDSRYNPISAAASVLKGKLNGIYSNEYLRLQSDKGNIFITDHVYNDDFSDAKETAGAPTAYQAIAHGFYVHNGNDSNPPVLIMSVGNKVSLPKCAMNSITDPKDLITKEYLHNGFIDSTQTLATENITKFVQGDFSFPVKTLIRMLMAKINGLISRTNDMRTTIVSRYLGNLTSTSNYFPLFAAVGHYVNRYEIIVSGVYNGFVFYYVTNFTRNLDTVQDINLTGMTNSKMTINLHGALSLTIGGVDINAQNSLTVTVNRIS